MFREIIIIIVFSLMAISSADAATIYVPDNYPTIQDAINAAVNGDTVIVRSGTYVENIDFVGKAITVMSESGPAATLIDGGQPSNPDFASVVAFQNGEGSDSVLEGFTLTNGSGTLTIYGLEGGGIYGYEASPTIRGNWIHGNTATGGGGGILIWSNASPMITDNRIFDNTSAWEGSGVSCWGPGGSHTISGNNIFNNICTKSVGGGIVLGDNCTGSISNNEIFGNEALVDGGGIVLFKLTSATVKDNRVHENTAGEIGGGVVAKQCTASLINNMIWANIAQKGGGVAIHDYSDITVTNGTVYGNSAAVNGGGIICTLNSDMTIINTILWNNDAPAGPEMKIGISSMPSTVTISHSDVDGGQASIEVGTGCTLNWGAGMIDANPRFAEATGGDFHLPYNSPCRDAGDNAATGLPAEDFEGDPRIADAAVDMGADEFYPHLYCVGDVVPGGKFSVRIVGQQGTSSVTLAMGSGVLDPPQSTQYGDLYLAAPIRQREVGPIPSFGIIGLSPVAPGTWQAGEQYPLQALVGPLGNPNSILTNLLTLTVE